MRRKSIAISVVLLLLVALAFANTAGPTFPTAASGSTNTIGGGTVAWTNFTNITANDGTSATCLPGVAVTDDLRGGTFVFSIPTTATIKGIVLEVNASAGVAAIEKFNTVVLEGGGGASANRATAATLTTSLSTFTFGSASDLWGTTWTPAQINAAGFVGNVSFVSTASGPGTLSVDFMRVTVTFSTPGGTGFMTFSRNRRPEIRTQTRSMVR